MWLSAPDSRGREAVTVFIDTNVLIWHLTNDLPDQGEGDELPGAGG